MRRTTAPRVRAASLVGLVGFAGFVGSALALAGCHAKSAAPAASADASPTASPQATAAAFDGTTASALTESAAHLFDDEAPEAAAAVVGPLTLQLSARGSDKSDLRISLDRIWAICQANPDGCEAATRDFVTKSVRTLRMRSQPAARDQVVAIVRPRAYVDRVGGPSAPNTLIAPLFDDLFVLYMIDLPGSMRSLATTELEALGLDRGQLPALAVQNLATRLGHLSDALGDAANAAPGAFNVLRSGNVFESSRLLVGDEWAALATSVGKPVIVGAPSGDVLLVAIGPTGDQLASMRETVGKLFATAQRPVSPRLYRWATNKWAVVQ